MTSFRRSMAKWFVAVGAIFGLLGLTSQPMITPLAVYGFCIFFMGLWDIQTCNSDEVFAERDSH